MLDSILSAVITFKQGNGWEEVMFYDYAIKGV